MLDNTTGQVDDLDGSANESESEISKKTVPELPEINKSISSLNNLYKDGQNKGLIEKLMRDSFKYRRNQIKNSSLELVETLETHEYLVDKENVLKILLNFVN